MTQENGKDIDRTLDRLFQEARAEPPPSDRLMQAVLRDAAAEMPRQDSQELSSAAPARGRRWFQPVPASLGGWRSITALAVSTCAGLWIGYVAPESAGVFGTDLSAATGGSVDLLADLPGADFTLYTDIEDLLTEGS